MWWKQRGRTLYQKSCIVANKMLPAMHCMRCGGCPSLSSAGICLTGQSQGSPVTSAATSNCVALLTSLFSATSTETNFNTRMFLALNSSPRHVYGVTLHNTMSNSPSINLLCVTRSDGSLQLFLMCVCVWWERLIDQEVCSKKAVLSQQLSTKPLNVCFVLLVSAPTSAKCCYLTV